MFGDLFPDIPVELVCPFDSSPEHFSQKVSPRAPKENIERLIARHLDAEHPGWTIEEVLAAAELQREDDLDIAPLPEVYGRARSHATLNDILHRNIPAHRAGQ